MTAPTLDAGGRIEEHTPTGRCPGRERRNVMRLSCLPHAAALALALTAPMAAPAAAQSMSAITQGVMAPCTETHFDADRYVETLAEAGWQPVPDDAQELAAEMLAEAFLVLTHPRQTRVSPVADRLQEARSFWQDQINGGLVLMLFESVLFLRGAADAEGTLILDCWLVTPDAEFVDGLIAEADAEAAAITDLGVAASWGPDPMDADTALSLFATRQPLPEGVAHGLHTQLVRMAEE